MCNRDVERNEFLKYLPKTLPKNSKIGRKAKLPNNVTMRKCSNTSSFNCLEQSFTKFSLKQVDFESESSEKKILNSYCEKVDAFLENCSDFEKALKKLNFFDSSITIYEEALTKIHKLIEEKISYLRIKAESHTSVKSSSSHNLSFEEFLSAVICPFCSEIQNDKISLVKHLDENCSPYLNKVFQKKEHLPYSAFQILPNNTFKCNICSNAIQSDLKHFYVHMNSSTHGKAYAKAIKERNYEKSLFCSCCKVLVFNTFTQISSHINHEVHNTKSKNKKKLEYFQIRGIHCLFTENKKFKCLNCPAASASCSSYIDIINHLEDHIHTKFRKKNAVYSSVLYCEVCSNEVPLHKIINHFTSSQHDCNEKKLQQSYELCVFCGFICDSIMELAFHMESKCDEITSARQKMSVAEKSKLSDLNMNCSSNLSQNEIEEQNHIPNILPKVSSKYFGNKIEKETGTKTRPMEANYLTVTNFTNIPELFKYFSEFGEILSIESHNDSDITIEFREESAVRDILLLRGLLKIDGLQLEITVDSKPFKSNKEMHPTEKDGGESYCDDKSSVDDSEAEIDSDMVAQREQLEELFRRVADHLINTTKNAISSGEGKILRDCILTLKIKNCNLVGFSSCGLSFPFENLSMFCACDNCDLYKDTSNGEFSIFTKNLLSTCHKKLSNSDLWEAVTFCENGYFSIVNCVHKETKKACTVTAATSTLLLTDMLRDCMEKNDLVRPFCLIIRFWLTVHELKIGEMEFAVISLLVFFLISEEVALLPELKYSNSLLTSFLKEELQDFQPLSKSNKQSFSNVKELFQKFLCFLHKFDFDKYAICLPFHSPVPKSVFTRTKFKLLSGVKNPASLLSCHMCIIDPICVMNIASNVKKKDRDEFLAIVKASIKCYKI